MRSYYFILQLLILTFGCPIWASQCRSLYQETRSNVEISESFSSKDRVDIEGTVAKVDVALSRLVKPDTYKVLRVRDLFESMLTLSAREILFAVREGPQRQTAFLVLAHEYGHAYFYANYKVKLRDSMVPMSGASEFLQSIEKEVYKGISQGGFASIGVIYKELEFARAQNTIHHELTKPYNELFGDLVAVIVAGKGTAMAEGMGVTRAFPFFATDSQALKYSHVDLTRTIDPLVRSRDFSKDIDIKGFEPELGSRRDYSVLDPARSYIWRKYRNYLRSPDKVGLFMTAFIRATEAHVSRRTAARDFDIRLIAEANPEQLNREFLFHLRQALRQVGLEP